MKINKKTRVFSTLILIIVLLVGFTTWGLTTNTFVVAYSRHKVNKECLIIEDISLSNYCEQGFINDEEISNIGILSVNIGIAIDEITDKYESLVEDNSIRLNINLSESNKNNFNDFISNCFMNTESNYLINSSLNQNKVKTQLIIENVNELNESIKLNILYFFDVSSLIVNTTFKESVYDKLINVGLTFKVVALVV